jgi:hypothetical protein
MIHFVGISTIVCGSFWGLKKNQNGGRCHGNEGTGGFLYFGGYFGFEMAVIANQRWISIHNIIIYLETKFCPNRRILVV